MAVFKVVWCGADRAGAHEVPRKRPPGLAEEIHTRIVSSAEEARELASSPWGALRGAVAWAWISPERSVRL